MQLVILLAFCALSFADEAGTQTRVCKWKLPDFLTDWVHFQPAYLVTSKMALSTYAVENMDLVMEYGIFNTGDKPATKVLSETFTWIRNIFFRLRN